MGKKKNPPKARWIGIPVDERGPRRDRRDKICIVCRETPYLSWAWVGNGWWWYCEPCERQVQGIDHFMDRGHWQAVHKYHKMPNPSTWRPGGRLAQICPTEITDFPHGKKVVRITWDRWVLPETRHGYAVNDLVFPDDWDYVPLQYPPPEAPADFRSPLETPDPMQLRPPGERCDAWKQKYVDYNLLAQGDIIAPPSAGHGRPER